MRTPIFSEVLGSESELSDEQKQFLITRAKLEATRDERRRRMEERDDVPELTNDSTDEEIKKHTEIEAEIGEELNLFEIEEEMREAREELVEWAFDTIEENSDKDEIEELDEGEDLEYLRENYAKYHDIKERVIEICMSYTPENNGDNGSGRNRERKERERNENSGRTN